MPRSDRSLTGAHEALKTTPKTVKPYVQTEKLTVGKVLPWVAVALAAVIAYPYVWPVLRSWLGGV